MKRIEITQNLYQYQFEPDPGKANGTNLFALISGTHVLLIDTGYMQHAKPVLADLQSRELVPSQIVFSHFHPDHIDGLEAFKNVEIFGSEHYAIMQEKYSPEITHLFKSIHTLTEGDELTFGDFHLNFHLSPGHSPCSMYIVINDSIVHVADTLIATNNGEPICPVAEYKDVEEYILSLERLLALSPQILLLGHGKMIESPTAIQAEVNDHLIYLSAVRDGGGTLSFEDATKNCTRKFLNKQWHIQSTPPQPE